MFIEKLGSKTPPYASGTANASYGGFVLYEV